MSEETLQKLLTFFKVLADETRLRILGLLASGERSVQELAGLLDLRDPTVSHHLARLRDLDLVRMRQEGNVHHYQLNPEALQALSKDILTPQVIARAAFEGLDEDRYHRRIVDNYLEEGRLKSLPAQRKKRDVVLRWLVEHFEVGRKYAEAEVNEILKRRHDDFATLRREFIMGGLMQREGGFYWRTDQA